MPFALSGWAPGYTHSKPPKNLLRFSGSSHGLRPSSEAAQAPSRCLESPVFQRSDVWSYQTPTSSSSLEVFTPSAFPPLGAAASIDRACVSRSPAPPGFLNLMTLSSAPSLPALFHAGSALGVHPPKLSSSCAAVRCFQRLSPLGVPTAFRVLLRARVRHSASDLN
jgi:hypothetical protein